MREISCKEIEQAVKKLFMDANYYLPDDIKNEIKRYESKEVSNQGKAILNQIIDNVDLAAKETLPLCQDTGLSVVLLEIGQDLHITDGFIEDAVNEGVRKAYKEGFLRKSIVEDGLHRVNTGDNTPAIIHYEMVKGDSLTIKAMPKGFGSENMSRLTMLKPSDGVEGVKAFVIETVEKAGPNPCPPIIVGVGIGANFERCAYLAKKALFRPIAESNENAFYRELEDELLTAINNLGIGPQGLGGITTALKVQIESAPTHIAGLPIAVNITCHASRHKEIIL